MPEARDGDKPFTVLWLQSAGCGGCTMSLLCAESPSLTQALEDFGIQFLWHPSLSEETGDEVTRVLERVIAGEQHLDALCVEGAMLRGPGGSGRFHVLSGTGIPTIDWVRRLAEQARYVLAVGTCSSFGGICADEASPTDACGLQYENEESGGLLGEAFRSAAGLPVINLAGCPTHPQWVIEALMALALDELGDDDLDELARPRAYADHLVHHGCPRNEYYEFKASAEEHSQLGCLMEHLGCVGTQAHADCNIRPWNGEGSCLRGGFACVNCTAPGFQDSGGRFLTTPKVAGIPVGLPRDMPKAWFVALSSLSKAATPERVRENAGSDHVVAHPANGRPPRLGD